MSEGDTSWTSRPCQSRLILQLFRFLLHSASRLGLDGVTDFRVATLLVQSITAQRDSTGQRDFLFLLPNQE